MTLAEELQRELDEIRKRINRLWVQLTKVAEQHGVKETVN